MQFNLRFFKMALMTGACLTSFGYSASSDVVVVDDILASALEKPKKIIAPGQAVNNRDLRDDFFTTYDGDKEKLLKALIGISVMDVPYGKQTRDFLKEAARKGFFTVEELAIPLSGNKASLAQYLQGAAKWSTTTASQQPLPIQARAFAAPQTLHVEPTDLPGALKIAPAASTLTSSEQIYVLNVRSNLANAGLDAALIRLDEILTLTQQAAIAEKTEGSYERSANLVNLIGTIRGISPVVSGYLRSVDVQLTAIVPTEEKFVPGALLGSFWGSSVREFSAEQQQQRTALQARQELALAVFDAFLGTIVRPVAVPAAVDFRADPTPANRLTSAVFAVHATLPAAVVASKAFTVNGNGTVGDEAENAATTVICAETTAFLKQIWAAAILTGNTAITEFEVPAAQDAATILTSDTAITEFVAPTEEKEATEEKK